MDPIDELVALRRLRAALDRIGAAAAAGAAGCSQDACVYYKVSCTRCLLKYNVQYKKSDALVTETVGWPIQGLDEKVTAPRARKRAKD